MSTQQTDYQPRHEVLDRHGWPASKLRNWPYEGRHRRERRMHMGRAWSGHDIEDGCPCVKAPCGLVDNMPDPLCVQHAGSKTLRQMHYADRCPARDGA